MRKNRKVKNKCARNTLLCLLWLAITSSLTLGCLSEKPNNVTKQKMDTPETQSQSLTSKTREKPPQISKHTRRNEKGCIESNLPHPAHRKGRILPPNAALHASQKHRSHEVTPSQKGPFKAKVMAEALKKGRTQSKPIPASVLARLRAKQQAFLREYKKVADAHKGTPASLKQERAKLKRRMIFNQQ